MSNLQRKNKYIINYILIITIIIFFSLTKDVVSGEKYSVSITKSFFKETERVVAFKLSIKSGRIFCLPNAPIGWFIDIDNDPSQNTIIKGNIKVGAAALGRRFFNDFIVIEKDNELSLPFLIELEIWTTTDFENDRHIVLKMKDLKLKKLRN